MDVKLSWAKTWRTNIFSEGTFCICHMKPGLSLRTRKLRVSPCDVWSCEIHPRRIRSSQGPERARVWCSARIEIREGGNSWTSLFFLLWHVRAWASRRDRRGARDLCTRVKSRVAASGKRNWSRYAPCEKATEINGRARARNRRLDSREERASSCTKLRWEEWSRVQ